MIQTFTHKGLERFFRHGEAAGQNPGFLPRLERMLDRLNAAADSTQGDHLFHTKPIGDSMAIRLARLLNTRPESWLNMQQALDLWELEQTGGREYARIEIIAA